MTTEQRFTQGGVTTGTPEGMTVREAGERKRRRIRGVAARFYDGTPGTEFQLFENTVERIMPGAFDRAIAERDDVRALFNHDANLLLGRTSSGTLKLEVKSDGLHYSIDPAPTSYTEDLRELLERGDVSGSSFAFRVDEETWSRDNGVDVREIRSLTLMDVSPVTYPAYTATSARVAEVAKPIDWFTRKALIKAEQAACDLRIQAALMG